jgi:ParB-like chromosome segregation protein Spo0J
MKIHPVAKMFPLLDEGSPEREELELSIEKNGLLEPLVVDGDVLLDGRNRLSVCCYLGIEPRFVEWKTLKDRGSDQASFIIAKNLSRRHLTPDQRGGDRHGTKPPIFCRAERAEEGGRRRTWRES